MLRLSIYDPRRVPREGPEPLSWWYQAPRSPDHVANDLRPFRRPQGKNWNREQS